jgi:hypothetical protein
MSGVPTPIKVALGLAAAAAEEARKLPETLPSAMSTVPMLAVSTAMQASLRLQQQLATLAAKGDEVISLLRPPSHEAPSWATFDDPPAEAARPEDAPLRAAFDRIDYENTGYAEGDEGTGRWDAVGAGAGVSATTDPSADHQPAMKAAANKAPAKKAPAKKAPAKKAPAKKAPAPGKKAPAKKAPAKKAPAKKAPAGRAHEPLEDAARRARPDAPPNPVTMAAEIERAQDAENTAE